MRELALVVAVVASASSGARAQVPARPIPVAVQLTVAPTLIQSEPAPDEPEPAPAEYEPPPAALRTLTLTPPQALPAVERRYRWPLWRVLTGSALLIGGGVLFGYGMSAFAYNGVCVPTPPPGVLACRRYYDTQDKGIALTTSGVLTAVGGVLFATIPSRKTQPKVTAQLLFPSLGVTLSGNF